jgi:hypothetical protein
VVSVAGASVAGIAVAGASVAGADVAGGASVVDGAHAAKSTTATQSREKSFESDFIHISFSL